MVCDNQNHRLKELLEEHGIRCFEEWNWIIPYGELPAIRMFWYPKPQQITGVLQVEVLIEEGIVLVEYFAGIGEGLDGLTDGIDSFINNSLHVLLAAFWGQNYPEQVEIERWLINNYEYDVYIGPITVIGSNGNTEIPENTFEKIEQAIKMTNLTEKYCWFRTYFGNVNGKDCVFEALANNEWWEEGEKALKSVDWVDTNLFYSFRNFIVAVKSSSENT
ncbi:MAG: hypothetical protein F6K23_05965 [Okeania sp. SIO2C9]|uniref:DUF6348 family protein n=1 Tax=Okeania sp. SIO2C9 TaxID=2607791 RepID=UPI0013C1EA5A|nr:DUF6348 family protein [Okeania sp. SIO2C9]NEQ72652.1 hypothetical protein [Okeania sp. SIO2C9]